MILLYKIFRYIITEPSNKGFRLKRCSYALLWQFWKRFVKRPIIGILDNGNEIILDPRARGSSFIAYTQTYDSHIIRFIRENVRNGGILIDVGANIGLYSMHLKNTFCKVYAFEPDELAHELLRKNLLLDPKNESVTVCKAVGSQNRIVSFLSVGKAGLSNHVIDGVDDNATTVEQVTLDSFIPINEWKNVSFIKIDVEGNEIEVLLGAKDLLINGGVCLVLFERLQRTPLKPIMDFFNKISWELFTLDKQGHKTATYSEIEQSHDLFASPKS